MKWDIRFIDSFKFMASSLSGLVDNLNDSQHKNMMKYYSENKLNILLRKGVFPYDHMDSITKFDENILPPRESFYNCLCDENLSETCMGCIWL